ncbi:MAG: MerR family transcriptional regulator [Desulfobacter sp.]|nr:MAG: MerR family transcriptional regulator [Desulfobacter sp.]
MKYKERYTIGEVSKICNISTKALRYYDKIGLIHSERAYTNNYRYYTKDSLLAVPVIKYYKQMGFTLDEMRDHIEGNSYRAIKRSFESKIDELQETQEATRRKFVSVKDWRDLINEAETVIDNNSCEVSIKYIEASDYLFLDQVFDNDLWDSIINIEFTNYVEAVNNEITGPVMIKFSSYRDRMKNTSQPMKIMQKTIIPCKSREKMVFGGEMMASCYHIGAHENLAETYEKIRRWADGHSYVLGEASYERYVTDYWTTRDSGKYVTEVMLSASRG